MKKILTGLMMLTALFVVGCSNNQSKTSNNSNQANSEYNDLNTRQKVAIVAQKTLGRDVTKIFYYQDDEDFVISNVDKTKIAEFELKGDKVEMSDDSKIAANKTYSIKQLMKTYYLGARDKQTVAKIVSSMKVDKTLDDINDNDDDKDDQDNDDVTTNSNNASANQTQSTDQSNNNSDSRQTTDLQNADEAVALLTSKYGDCDWSVGYGNKGMSDNVYWTIAAGDDSDDGSVQEGQMFYVHADGTIEKANI